MACTESLYRDRVLDHCGGGAGDTRGDTRGDIRGVLARLHRSIGGNIDAAEGRDTSLASRFINWDCVNF